MAWQDEMLVLERVLLNDLDVPYTYSDARLQKLLVVAAHFVVVEMSFSQAFKADLTNLTIAPDPTDDGASTRDDSFLNMVCLKGACIVDRGEASRAAKNAVLVKDPSHTFDLRGPLEGKLALLDKGWCAVYEDAKLEYLAGQVRVAGAVIMSPFRFVARENYRGLSSAWPGGDYRVGL